METITSNLWIWLVLLYGLLRGTRDVIRKKAMEKSTMMEVLFFYTFLSFIFVSYEGRTAFSIDYSIFGLVLLKSFMVFAAWLCSFSAIKKLPVSFFGVIEMSSVLFSTAMGVVFLGENLTLFRALGTLTVMFGLFMLNLKRQTADPNNVINFQYVSLALASCLFNAVSGVLDKVILQKNVITTGQLQFWFMLLMSVFYLIFLLASRTKIDFSCLWKNPYIIVMAVLFVLGDRALFKANTIPQSEVMIMTLLKRSSCFVTILGGALVFREKNIIYRTLCGLLILAGIVIGMQ